MADEVHKCHDVDFPFALFMARASVLLALPPMPVEVWHGYVEALGLQLYTSAARMVYCPDLTLRHLNVDKQFNLNATLVDPEPFATLALCAKNVSGDWREIRLPTVSVRCDVASMCRSHWPDIVAKVSARLQRRPSGCVTLLRNRRAFRRETRPQCRFCRASAPTTLSNERPSRTRCQQTK